MRRRESTEGRGGSQRDGVKSPEGACLGRLAVKRRASDSGNSPGKQYDVTHMNKLIQQSRYKPMAMSQTVHYKTLIWASTFLRAVYKNVFYESGAPLNTYNVVKATKHTSRLVDSQREISPVLAVPK